MIDRLSPSRQKTCAAVAALFMAGGMVAILFTTNPAVPADKAIPMVGIIAMMVGMMWRRGGR